jgi:release factor glutamine methyltransferase
MTKIPQEYKKDYYWLIKDKYHGKKPQTGKRLVEFEEDIKRLIADEPLDYIIGWKPFLNCKIDLSFKPHSPVPETEFWAEKFIDTIEENDENKKTIKILDVFSGSGCVGISVLKALRKTRVDFGEFEPRVVEQIKYNLKINRISPNRYTVTQSDVLESIGMEKYDYISSNPPYVPVKNKPKMKPWALKYWPQEALFGGQDGLYFIRKFLKQAKSRLAIDGSIWMEFDSSQKKEIEKLIKQNKYSSFSFQRDQYKRWRYVIINK